MFFRCCFRIKTIKILEFYHKADEKNQNLNEMIKLELTMKNGSIQHEDFKQRFALEKYYDFFTNPKDKNFIHNHDTLRKNNLLSILDKNMIPMHENATSENSKCILS